MDERVERAGQTLVKLANPENWESRLALTRTAQGGLARLKVWKGEGDPAKEASEAADSIAAVTAEAGAARKAVEDAGVALSLVAEEMGKESPDMAALRSLVADARAALSPR